MFKSNNSSDITITKYSKLLYYKFLSFVGEYQPPAEYQDDSSVIVDVTDLHQRFPVDRQPLKIIQDLCN